MASFPEPALRAQAPRYAELQVTTNFSFLRGAAHPDELVLTAAALGHCAIAITDRNSFAGIVRAHHAAKEAGIRLVVGCRLDLSDGTSLLAYPTDRAAYGRLTRLLTLGKRRAPKGECRLDYADVVAHGEGQIVVVLAELADFAGRVAADFAGRAYLAAHHLYRGDDARRLARLAALGEATGLPLVAVNDVLYHLPERRPLQDVLTCIREGCTIAEAGFRLAANAERHLKPPQEMARLFRGNEDVVERSLEIVERCRFSLDQLRYEYPEEMVPAGRTPQQYLEELTWEGAAERFSQQRDKPPLVIPAKAGTHTSATPNSSSNCADLRAVMGPCRGEMDPGLRRGDEWTDDRGYFHTRFCGDDERSEIPDKIRNLIEHELQLIERLDYARYFLTVQDIVRFARMRGILCQGRGSAANSVVCYCLGITAVDPARIDVLFERFISAARNEPPDIDVDFEHERREEVIQYVYDKYGRDRAGLAATVICYRSRSAIREVGKTMGLSVDVVAALAGIVWGWSNDPIADLRVREAGLDPTDRTLRLALDLAGQLVGFPRHLSQHVGGFVITRGPLSELVPIENAAMEDRTVIEWDKDDLDRLGILKIDVLALGMLTCIRKAFALIDNHYGRRLDLATVPAEDPAVYEMLSRADSLGVFQVESRAQMTMLPRLKPREFYDLVIEVAIVRPGPIQGDMVHPYLRRRSGREPVDYPSEALRQVLGKTMGVPLFQEQAMKIAIVGAGFAPDEADRLRRAMATFKRNGDIHLFRDKFVAGMVENGYDRDFATRCFSQIEGFGTYGFPESHAASFALLVYVSSWIKCFYPEVFACALLNSQPMGFYAPAQIVRDAREHDVEVRPVDVNHSLWDCTLEPLAVTPAQQVVMAGLGLRLSGWKKPVVCMGLDTTLDPLWPGLTRPSTPSLRPTVPFTSTWVAGTSPATARKGCALACGTFVQMQQKAEPDSRGLDPAIHALTARDNTGDGFVDARNKSGHGERKYDRTLEPLAVAPAKTRVRPHQQGSPRYALRLGFRQIKGFAEADAEQLVAARGEGYPDPHALWRRGGLGRGALERLAEADAFRSIGLDRRRALWALKALGEPPLPLFPDVSEDATGELLPEMPLGEHVVEDYASLSLSLKRHPLAFLRSELAREGLVTAGELAHLPVDRRLSIAGIVLIRQRPGSANGVVFITIEDETGIANLIVWPAILERFRRAALGATLLRCSGKLQREESVIHIVADRLEDMTPRLNTLRDRSGRDPPGRDPSGRDPSGDAEHRPLSRPPFASPGKPPGYDARDIVINSRNFR